MSQVPPAPNAGNRDEEKAGDAAARPTETGSVGGAAGGEASADFPKQGTPPSENPPNPAKGATGDAKAPTLAKAKAVAAAKVKTPAKKEADRVKADQRSATASPDGVVIEEAPPKSRFRYLLSEILHWTPSWFVSMVVHAAALLIMAMITIPAPRESTAQQLVVAPGENDVVEEVEDLLQDAPQDINLETDLSPIEVASNVDSSQDVSAFNDATAATAVVELSPIGLEHANQSDLMAAVGALSGNDMSGRGSGKARLVATAGGSAGSERAVALALKWLADHQMPDGGWSFDHTKAGGCNGQCRNPGSLADARSGATAMALLPFLGAGQTHREGEYSKSVRAGLYYLITNRMKVSPEGGSFYENGGSMYSHGLAAICLTEAYAMTRDKVLRAPAQEALNFIVSAQDPVGGGWRYQPRQKGDTSVVGWQLMALKSGFMGYLQIPPVTIQKATRFLDSVQSNEGANYGYTDPGAGPATTAVGLLCRMYMGWDKDNPALQRGVKWLSERGPSKTDMYYNYYATQVLRHWEGEEWKKWNSEMRDFLVNSQAKAGHETGSWFFADGHKTDRGGRLYCTALACMILEVYYRHLPLYRKQTTEESFPLD
ncbi:prenyltransferase/squalene oxidase repeat-containing protein [Thermopirellula anaerolimosa]